MILVDPQVEISHIESLALGLLLIAGRLQMLADASSVVVVAAACLTLLFLLSPPPLQWMELRFNTLAKCPHCKKM